MHAIQMKRPLIAILILVLALAGFLAWRWMSRSVVEVYVAKRGNAVSAVYGTVKVVYCASAKVRARTGGNVRFAKPATQGIGAEVKKGELIAEIVNEDLDREISKAEAELNTARQRRELGPQSLPALKTLEANVARLVKLAEERNVSASELERIRNELQSVRQEVTRQELELDRAVTVLTEQYQTLLARKERCRLVAPVDGTITAMSVLNGDYVADHAFPFTVSTKCTFVEGQVNEEDVGSIKPKMQAKVRLYSYPHVDFEATVRQVMPTANNQRYPVILDLKNPPDNLLAGMTGEVNVIIGHRENALIVPTRALVANKVFVVNHGVVQPRPVRVGFRNIERAEIVEGLQEGDRVVVADQDLLVPGQRVRAIAINP